MLCEAVVHHAVVLASCNATVCILSVAITFAAYVHRVRVEDAILVQTFGDGYASHRSEVPALIPIPARRR